MDESQGSQTDAELPHAEESFITTLSHLLQGLNPLLMATGLSLACLTPGPGGTAAALAAAAYDSAKRQWFRASLSVLSMIPALGYLPAIFKVGMLFSQLSRRLQDLEMITPEIRRSPRAIMMVREEFEMYYRRIPDIVGLRGLRKRLAAIMALDIDQCSDLQS